MTENQILETVRSLAGGKGLCSALYQGLLANPEELTRLAKLNFKDVVDLILYLGIIITANEACKLSKENRETTLEVLEDEE